MLEKGQQSVLPGNGINSKLTTPELCGNDFRKQ
jgi:hypothetical protein